MTKDNIIMICEKEGHYEFPELNTKLYLHFKGKRDCKCLGFRKISNLDEYRNVKVLWLENNLLTKIEGLDNLIELTTLFL